MGINFSVSTGSFNRMVPSLHSHHLSQKWCRDNFPSFIDRDGWPPNSPDLNPLDYSIWDQLVNKINWNKVDQKKTLIQELKVVRVGPIEYTIFTKMMEIIYVNKNSILAANILNLVV